MVTIIPKGNKIEIEDFAGTKETQVIYAYSISKYEITQGLYKAIMGENPSYHKGSELPVENVSFYDAIYFCNKLSEKCGLEPVYKVNGSTDVSKWNYTPHNDNSIYGTIEQDTTKNGYRLPTEAEWEMAARGGLEGGWDYNYSGSNNIDEVACYNSNSEQKTHEVGQKKPNAAGLYDMSETYSNGATTGTIRRRVLTASYVVVLGAAAPTTRLFATGTTTTRTTATSTWACALFAPRSNPIWVQKEGVSHASEAAVARAPWLKHSFCKKNEKSNSN